LKAIEYCSRNHIKIEQEVTIDPYDLIFVDMALKEKKAVIEINGPFHYLQGNSQKPL
jgi:very-short-patch-repair endonuclease